MPLTKSSTPIKDFLPSSYKLQVEKEAQAAEERKKFSDGPGRYLRAPKEGKNPKTGKPEPGSVEFRVMSDCEFGFSLWYTEEEGAPRNMRWLQSDLIARGVEGGEIPADEIPATCQRYDKSKKPKIVKFLSMVVFNITEDAFQIWDLDKSTMLEQLLRRAPILGLVIPLATTSFGVVRERAQQLSTLCNLNHRMNYRLKF